MATSRRDFLKKGSLVALVAGAPLALAEKVIASEPKSAASALGFSQAEFERFLNTSFLIKEGTRRIPVKLIAVDDWRRTEDLEKDKECFGLRFRGRETTRLKQNTYSIEHSSLGSFSLLLVPVGPNEEVPQYEAIINRVDS
jgi:hypothetical protein